MQLYRFFMARQEASFVTLATSSHTTRLKQFPSFFYRAAILTSFYNAAILLPQLLILVVCFSSCGTADAPVQAATGDTSTANIIAVNSRTLFTEVNGGKLAYRVIGMGKPIILCNRFRGIMDDWDPLFLDELAEDHQVVIFDYSGVGLSTLPNEQDSLRETADIAALAQLLGFSKFSLMGWSHGGKVAQVYTAQHTGQVDKLVLLGSGPIGKTKLPPEKVFFDHALKPVNDFNDEIILFFEPKYEASRRAAKLSRDRMKVRTVDTSRYVTPDKFTKYFQSVAVYNANDAALDTLFKSAIPMLVISGEHDIVFPIENWYDQTRKNPNLQIVMLPKAGHGPQSQYPTLTAGYIRNFLSTEEL
jgi:pimeloyl-ACP methyl ester carboxylesterase